VDAVRQPIKGQWPKEIAVREARVEFG
jgi:hypothetical protein